jgi:plasmid stabilization system protein ParE
MNYTFKPEAEKEIDQQIDYYNEKRSGLGYEFFDEVIDTIAILMDFPETWPPVNYKNCRKYRLDQFREIEIIYQFNHQKQEIDIIAVAHSKRKSGYWKDRL